MNDPLHPHGPVSQANVIALHPSGNDPGDPALLAELRAALQATPDDAARRLERRVLADWRRYVAAPGPSRPVSRTPHWAAIPAWVGAASLVAGVCLVYSLWLRQGNDAALDELSQIDVLSQMAAGEM